MFLILVNTKIKRGSICFVFGGMSRKEFTTRWTPQGRHVNSPIFCVDSSCSAHTFAGTDWQQSVRLDLNLSLRAQARPMVGSRMLLRMKISELSHYHSLVSLVHHHCALMMRCAPLFLFFLVLSLGRLIPRGSLGLHRVYGRGRHRGHHHLQRLRGSQLGLQEQHRLVIKPVRCTRACPRARVYTLQLVAERGVINPRSVCHPPAFSASAWYATGRWESRCPLGFGLVV